MTHPTRLVITGTGTDVGKTHLTCHLATTLVRAGVPTVALKPVETGYHAPTSDAARLAASAGHTTLTPLFTSPVPESPHRVARQAGVHLTAAGLSSWVRASSNTEHACTLVETAGGLFTPLSNRETMLSVVAALEPCVFVLVAESRLGTLHDVGAATHAAALLHRRPDVVLLNTRTLHTRALANASELRMLGLADTLFEVGAESDLLSFVSWLWPRLPAQLMPNATAPASTVTR